MTVPVAQVPSFTLEPSKGNTQVGQIKGNFDQKVFTLFEKSGFSLPEPLQILSKKGKEITSSHYTSIEKKKESKEGKTPQRASVFECIGRLTPRVFAFERLTPRVSAFERLSCKDERGSSKQVDEYVTTSKTSVFHRLGTK
ncbi:hypothetical protein MTR67_035618 [Solanum verrucosum]|uniref:Uncharacterized protein n=1 Tax=Solanum verrucosum TaxID=315347 RepID=A0AAF0UA71_SOLVR|nr:hypothetical protein MTR67_035618 [Solanum verrucosum]